MAQVTITQAQEPKHSESRDFLSSVAVSLGLRLAAVIFGFLAQLFLARTLAPHEFGLVMYVLAWVNLALVPSVLGFDTAAVRFFADFRRAKDIASMSRFLAFSRRTVTALSVSVCLVFTTVGLVNNSSTSNRGLTFVAGAVALPLMAHLKIAEGGLRGFGSVKQAQIGSTIVAPAGWIVIAAVAFYVDADAYGPATVLLARVAAHVIALACAAVFLRQTISRWRARLLGRDLDLGVSQERLWMSTAAGLTVVSGMTLILGQIDVVIVGAVLGDAEAGAYAVATRVSGLLGVLLVAVNFVIAPSIVEHTSRNASLLQVDGFQRLVRRATTISFYGALLGGIAILVCGREILTLFGESYSDGVMTVLLPLLAAQLVNAVCGPVGLVLNMTGHQGVSGRILGAAVVANLVLDLLLVPRIGLVGAAVATIASTAIWNFGMLVVVWRRFGVWVLPWWPTSLFAVMLKGAG